MDETTNFLRLTPDQYNDLQSVFFDISGSIFEFIPNAQIWPRDLNHIIGGSPDYVYLIFQNVSPINISLPVDSNQRSCCWCSIWCSSVRVLPWTLFWCTLSCEYRKYAWSSYCCSHLHAVIDSTLYLIRLLRVWVWLPQNIPTILATRLTVSCSFYLVRSHSNTFQRFMFILRHLHKFL